MDNHWHLTPPSLPPPPPPINHPVAIHQVGFHPLVGLASPSPYLLLDLRRVDTVWSWQHEGVARIGGRRLCKVDLFEAASGLRTHTHGCFSRANSQTRLSWLFSPREPAHNCPLAQGHMYFCWAFKEKVRSVNRSKVWAISSTGSARMPLLTQATPARRFRETKHTTRGTNNHESVYSQLPNLAERWRHL